MKQILIINYFIIHIINKRDYLSYKNQIFIYFSHRDFFTTTCETKLLKADLFSFIKDNISGCRNILQSRSSELLLSGEIRNASNTRRKDDKCLSVFSLITDDLLCRIWSRRLVEIYSCSSKMLFFIHNTRFRRTDIFISLLHKKIDICKILRNKSNLIYYFNFVSPSSFSFILFHSRLF